MNLWISKKIPKPMPYQPRDVIAVDVDEEKIVYEDQETNVEKNTEIDRAHR